MMTQTEATTLVYDALNAAVSNDTETSSGLLERLGADSDDDRMYGICCSIADAGLHVLTRMFGDRAPDLERGGMWTVQQLKPGALEDDPAQAFSLRFLVAYCNDDRATTIALYNAAHKAGGDEFVRSLCTLLADVAGLCRSALEQQETRRR